MKRTPLRFRSKKTENKYKLRRALVEKLLKERPKCEACPPFAREDGRRTFVVRASQDVHELIRRSRGGSILDEKNLLCVCRPCHRRITDNPDLAERLGLELPSWATDEMFVEAQGLRASGGNPSWVD